MTLIICRATTTAQAVVERLMLFAAYADVGAGLAFLLLLALSSAGLVVVLSRARLSPETLRNAKLYIIAIGFLQAWLLYLWARLNPSQVPRPTLEWLWLGSLGIVVVALAAAIIWPGHAERR
jgi:hypothetical protein